MASALHYIMLSALVALSWGNIPPKWNIADEGQGYRTIREDAPVGSVVCTLNGTDEDGGTCVYGILEVGIRYFDVDPITGVVKLVRQLDREARSQYHLTATLMDGVNTVRREITFHVEDANDNSPEFEGLPYTCDIPETTLRGSRIFQAAADDPDLGPSGTVVYSLEPLEADVGLFSIDPNDGWVSLAVGGTLQADLLPVHALTIRASDQGGDLDGEFVVQSSTATLAVNVISVRPQQMAIKENRPAGSLVGFVEPFAPDEGDMLFYIIGGNVGETFSLDSVSLALTTNRVLDREATPAYNLVIKAAPHPLVGANDTSFGNTSDTSQKTISIVVEDENDNEPYFTKDLYATAVMLGRSAEGAIFTVPVEDADLFDPATRHFEIYHVEYYRDQNASEPAEFDHGAVHKLFSVGKTDGDIHLNGVLDNKYRNGRFDLHIKVTDPTKGWYDSTIVVVNALTNEQRSKIVFRGRIKDVQRKIEQFRTLLNEVLSADVKADDLRAHIGAQGELDETKTDLWIYAIDRQFHSIINAERVISTIDANDEAIQSMLMDFNVISVERADSGLASGLRQQLSEHFYKAGMMATIPVGCIVIFLLSGMLYCMRKSYRTKLRAANALNSIDSAALANGSFRKMSCEVLGTNKYSSEGSNPIWNPIDTSGLDPRKNPSKNPPMGLPPASVDDVTSAYALSSIATSGSDVPIIGSPKLKKQRKKGVVSVPDCAELNVMDLFDKALDESAEIGGLRSAGCRNEESAS